MQISKSTIEVLRNFADINDSILIKPGNRLVSFHNSGTVLANAKVEDTFEDKFGIYDLSSFLALTALIEDPDVDTSNGSYVIISGSGSRFKFFVADESLITKVPKDELTLPTTDLEFSLDEDSLKRVLRAAAVFVLDTIQFYSEDGGLHFGVSDPKQKNSDSFSVRICDYDGPEIKLVVSIGKLTFMPGNYKVGISYSTGQIMLQFTNTSRDVRYWTAPEAESTVAKK